MKTLLAVAALLFSSLAFAQTPAAARRRAVRPETQPVLHHTVTLAPSKDNTLYQTVDGSISNGAGSQLFAGATGSRDLRRALLAFNITSQIPQGSQVTRVVLTLNVSASIAGAQPMSLHRVTTDWGEGASTAFVGFSWGAGGGRGAPAMAGDATWIHTFFPDRRWTKPGGDFDATPDATTTTAAFQYTWESPAMIARVQQWLDQPSTNFGWIVIGTEPAVRTAKRFNSREAAQQQTAPALMIEYDSR